jgi:hypothetical protein
MLAPFSAAGEDRAGVRLYTYGQASAIPIETHCEAEKSSAECAR